MRDVTVLLEIKLEVDDKLDREEVLAEAHKKYQDDYFDSIIMKTSDWDYFKEEVDFLLAIDSEME